MGKKVDNVKKHVVSFRLTTDEFREMTLEARPYTLTFHVKRELREAKALRENYRNLQAELQKRNRFMAALALKNKAILDVLRRMPCFNIIKDDQCACLRCEGIRAALKPIDISGE